MSLFETCLGRAMRCQAVASTGAGTAANQRARWRQGTAIIYSACPIRPANASALCLPRLPSILPLSPHNPLHTPHDRFLSSLTTATSWHSPPVRASFPPASPTPTTSLHLAAWAILPCPSSTPSQSSRKNSRQRANFCQSAMTMRCFFGRSCPRRFSRARDRADDHRAVSSVHGDLMSRRQKSC